MAFYSFTNESWTPEDGTVVVSTNTDYSFDGTSSRKVVWSSGKDKKVTISFDAVTLGNYEEISLQIHQRALLASGNTFKITVDGVVFTFDKLPRGANGWHHVLLYCSSMGSVTTIEIESLVADLTLFIDYLGYRKTDHDRDLDVVKAMQSAISLDYGTTTTLSADVAIGATSISLTSSAYINDTSVLELDDGVNTEEVTLTSKSGSLRTATTKAFTAGDTVTVKCPVSIEDIDDVDPDPICGIMIYDKDTDKWDTQVSTVNLTKRKNFTGTIGVLVYIDCRSKKKLLNLARQYDHTYGERFCIILDGEQVDVILSNSQYVDDSLGNNPRMAYFYDIHPQPYLVGVGIPLTSLTVTQESKDPELLYDTEVSG